MVCAQEACKYEMGHIRSLIIQPNDHVFLISGLFLMLLSIIVLPENWVCLLVGLEPKDTTKSKNRRRNRLLLAASKENTMGLSSSSVSPNSKIGEVLS